MTQPASIKSGVPQGSILGPTLFLMFINDLPLFMEHSDADCYADDTTIHAYAKTQAEVESKLQNDGNNARSWSKQNKMILHCDKTTCMIVGTRYTTQNVNQLDIHIDSDKIKTVTSQKLLGVNIDQNLLWTEHIDYLCSTITSKISLLKQLSLFIPVEAQKLFYQSYILPLIDYGSITWGNTSRSNLERLSKLQKRAARIILKAAFDTPSSYMFKQLGWETIPQRHNYNKAVLVYKALNNMTPSYISELLTPMSQIHSRTLRSTTDGSLSVPRSYTTTFDGAFSCSAPKIWNCLPDSIRKATSLNVFKSQVKEHFSTF